jgi:tetratricopeptide (TPR) repeat protein
MKWIFRRLLRAPRRVLFRGSLFVGLCALSGCTLSSQKIEFDKAQEASQKHEYHEALAHYQNTIQKDENSRLSLQATQEAAKIAHYELKDFALAVTLYKRIVLLAPEESQRIEAEKKIADLYFSQMLDYNQAIVEFHRLLELPHSPAEAATYQMGLARSYFYLNDFFQSQTEIEAVLNTSKDANLLFDALLLKANIRMTGKKLDDAIDVLKELMQKYPERSRTEAIGLVLAVCYEEKKDFGKAIETLEALRATYPRKAFIENRIKILRERQSYLPGARGLHK